MDKCDGTHEFPKWMGDIPRVCAPWCPEEEEVLVADFKAGMSLKDQCAKHGRATGGINSRLARLLDGESHWRKGLTQQERDELLHEVKLMRQRVTEVSNRLSALTSRIYALGE